MTANKRSTKRDHIMDVAEILFARSGFDGVSVREITDAAEVRLASVNYYFKSKEMLYFEVLARRAVPIVRERQRMLSEINFDSLERDAAIKQIVKSIVDPLFERIMSGDPGWRAWASVITAFASKELTPYEDAPIMNAIDRVSLEFIEKLHHYSHYETDLQAHLAFQFITTTALAAFANNGRINTLSENRYQSSDYDSHYPASIDFIVAGTIAMLTCENA